MKRIVQEVSRKLQVSQDEAELIIATLLEQPRFGMYFTNEIDTETAVLLRLKLEQLKSGVPIEYITKKVQFMDYSFSLYPGVFIPRLETEYFIELIKKLVIHEPKKILEIGTGCGAIAISLAKIFTNAKIIATDTSELAITNAAENIRKYKLSDHIRLCHCDMFDGLTGRFDLIVSNPPYIPRFRLSRLPKSVKDFEPLKALDGGYQGVMFIKQLLQQGQHYLNQRGALAFEIDEDEVEILKEFLVTYSLNFFVFKKDLFGRFRYLFVGDFQDEESKDIYK
jgi:release factor glutamine methyltransferase